MTFSLVYNPIWYLVKRNGEPAAGAKLYTFLASDKSTKKPFYKDVGGQNPWPNPIVFGDSSATQGEFYGEDGIAYYLRAVDADNNELWTVDNYLPPAASGGSPTINYFDNDNYFRNSDFRDNFYPEVEKDLTSLTSDVLIAAGPYVFKKNNSSGSDKIEFVKFTPGQTDVALDPIYYLNYQCTSAGSSEEKYIYIRFPNVYTFGGEAMSFALQAISSSLSTITIDYNQHFGTGGSPSSDVGGTLGAQVLTANWARYEILNKVIPSISGKTIGTNGDDYLEIRFGLPADITSNIGITQIQLEIGTKVNPYEYEDEKISRYRTTGGELPAIDIGDDVGKTNFLVPEFDDSAGMQLYGGAVPVGSIIMHTTDTVPPGYLRANGATFNQVGSDKSYLRLHNVIGQRYGVGYDAYYFFYPDTTTTVTDDTIYPVTSRGGVAAAPVDNGTGFTFTVEEAGKAPITEIDPYPVATSGVVIFDFPNTFAALNAAPTVGNLTGLTLDNYTTGTANRNAQFTFTFPAESVVSHGQYWLFSNTTTDYYVWYKINGVGTDPAVASRTGIEVNLVTGDTNYQLAQKTVDSILGRQRVEIVCLAESVITAGDYFDIFNGTNSTRIWYSIGGTGTAPAEPSSKLLGEVALTGGETATQVAAATTLKLQQIQFQLPDLRGYFPRFSDFGANVDPEASSRFSSDGTTNTSAGDFTGTKQAMQYQAHQHDASKPDSYTGDVGSGGGPLQLFDSYEASEFAGGKETRPVNVYVEALIKF